MYDDLIAAAADESGVPVALIRAVIKRESNWNTNAVGDGGLARGLGQMHPAAAAAVGANWNNLFDPQVSIPATAAYLALLYKHLQDWTWTVAAYNQGPTVIGRAKAYADAVMTLIASSVVAG